MTNYSEEANTLLKKEFDAHMAGHEEIMEYIKKMVRVINYANEPK